MKAKIYKKIILLSFIFLFPSFALSQFIQLSPQEPNQNLNQTQTQGMQKKTSAVVALPDLIVESIWLNNQNHICFKLKNIGLGSPKDVDFSLAKIKLSYGSEEKEYNLANIDPQKLLFKSAGIVSFTTDIALKEPTRVTAEIDFRNNIPEARENNNFLSITLTPKDLTFVQESISNVSEQKLHKIKEAKVLLQTIKVIYPNGGEIWKIGEKHNISWEFSGPHTNLEIAIKNNKRRILLTYTYSGSSSFEWIISKNIPPDSYKVEIISRDGRIKDESDGWIQITLPEVDLVVYLETPREVSNWYTKIRVINRGTRVLNNVFLEWLKIDINRTVRKQEGAGFNIMYPNRFYEVTIHGDVDCCTEVFVDRENLQRESEFLRYDNHISTCSDY